MMQFGNGSKTAKLTASVLLAMVLAGGATTAYLVHEQHEIRQREAEEIRQVNEQLNSVSKMLNDVNQQMETNNVRIRALSDEATRLKTEVSRQEERAVTVDVTAYDLSEDSCGKSMDDPGYGVTTTGFNLTGQSLQSARAIAVDPSVIPLGSKVRVKFLEPDMAGYNGTYTAVDTGGAINGNRVDLFYGDFGSRHANPEALAFGHHKAKVYFL